MKKIAINGKEYNIYFGYAATVKNGIIKKLVELENSNDETESVEKILLFLPELLLVGLQNFHFDEFGFNSDNEREKESRIEQVYKLLDSYFESDEGDIEKLYADLQNELIENGFLSKLFRKEQEAAEAKKKRAEAKKES